MAPYILLFSIYLLFPLTNRFFKNKEIYKSVYCAVIFTTVLLILGLRHPSMGIDLPGYLKSFHRLTELSWRELFSLKSYLNYERGYIIFNKVIGELTFETEQIFLFICATISTVPVWYIIRKKSEDIMLSSIIYLALPIFILQYSGIRQCIALGLCYISMEFIERKKFIPFLCLVLFACCFHFTAIIFILAYFMYHVRISDKARWLTLLIFPVVYVIRVPLFTVLSLIFKDNAVITQTNAVTMMMVFFFIYIFILFLCHGKWDKRTNGYMNIFMCACLCMIFSGIYSTAIRIGYYFSFSLVLLLPLALSGMKDRRWAFIFKCIIIVCFIWFAFDSITDTYWAMAYPYHPFWENVYYLNEV